MLRQWMVSANTVVDPGGYSFAYGNAGLFGVAYGFEQQSAVGNSTNVPLSGDVKYTISVPANTQVLLFVNATSGGSAHPLPEPGSVALLIGAGISGSVLLRRRRK